jgi:hypothetical protein
MYDLVSRQPGIEAVAIRDDLTLTGKPESLIDIIPVVTEQAAKLGLKVQPRKSQFIYFKNDSNPLSREVTDRLVELDIKLQTDDAIVLGCPIAKDNITLHRALSKSIHSIIESINSCMADSTVSSQSAILLLRSCFAQKIDYLMRCLGPSAFKGLESKFHANLIDSVLAKIGIYPVSTNYGLIKSKEQMSLPLKVGGLGLTPHGKRIDYCFISSLITASCTPTSMRGVNAILAENNPTLSQTVNDSLNNCHQLAENRLGQYLPRNVIQFTHAFTPMW